MSVYLFVVTKVKQIDNKLEEEVARLSFDKKNV